MDNAVNPYKKINLTAGEKAELDIAHAALEKFLAINLFGVDGNIHKYFGSTLAKKHRVTALNTKEENLQSVIFCMEKQRLPVIHDATTKVVFAASNGSSVQNLKCCLCNTTLESVLFKNLRLGNLCRKCRDQAGCKHFPEFNVHHNMFRSGNEYFVWEDGQIEHQMLKGRMGPAGKEGGIGNSPIDFYIRPGLVRFTLDDRNYRVLLSTPIHLEVYSNLHRNLEADHHHVTFAKEDEAILITIWSGTQAQSYGPYIAAVLLCVILNYDRDIKRQCSLHHDNDMTDDDRIEWLKASKRWHHPGLTPNGGGTNRSYFSFFNKLA